MTVEDPRHMLAAGRVTDPAGDRWRAAWYRCPCGFAADDAGEFDRHLDAAEGTGPEHFEVLAGWTFDQVRQWQAAAVAGPVLAAGSGLFDGEGRPLVVRLEVPLSAGEMVAALYGEHQRLTQADLGADQDVWRYVAVVIAQDGMHAIEQLADMIDEQERCGYAKLLAEGRVKAKPKKQSTTKAVHARRVGPGGRALPCRPYAYDTVRCFRTHTEDDSAIGRPIEPRKLGQRAAESAAAAAQRKLSPGLEPKTVVNTHRMLHRAWEDFTTWGWAKRNVVSDAHPPRVPRKGRKVWTVAQLQRFLQHARSDRFFALWVLEATSDMRRCELAGAHRDLLDLDAGTLAIETTRVVVDGRVIESDGKTENAQHVLALDPFTLAVLKAHVEQLDQERREFGPDYQDHGVLFCWEDGRPPHPDTITRRFKRLAAAAGLPEIDLHDVRHSYATVGRDAKIDWKALSQRIGHADVAFTMKQYVQTDLEADRQVANTLAELIVGGSLASFEMTNTA